MSVSSKKNEKVVACRICGGSLGSVLDLGELYLSTFVEKEGDNIGKEPLELAKCERGCGLVQLRHNVSQELLYSGKYWYRSGINPVIVENLKEIAVSMMHKAGEEKVWLDIGANDGTLLSFVEGFRRIGVEPASNLQEELTKHCELVVPKFWEDVKLDEKADVITAIGMFYDSVDPNQFIWNVKQHLAEDGVFIFQMATLKTMLELNDLGNICHEHLEYYSFHSLRELMERNGLDLVGVEENGINGGSYRCVVGHKFFGSVNIAEPVEDIEDFRERIEENKRRVVDFVKMVTAAGKKVYGYGASTKGNTILQYYGLDKSLIKGIADPNPEKIGKLAVGSWIPVVSEEEARADADYFLVLPWGFLDSFKERERDWVKKGGSFITHTPYFSVQ